MSTFIETTASSSETVSVTVSANELVTVSANELVSVSANELVTVSATEKPKYIFQIGQETDIGGSNTNQDESFVLIDTDLDLVINCILDGHGSDYGEHIAKGTKEFMTTKINMEKDKLLDNPQEYLTALFLEANENCKQILMEVLSKSSIQFKEEYGIIYSRKHSTSMWSKVRGGTTCTMVVIIKNKLFTANVGDSKSLLCSRVNRVQELTTDQSLEKFEEFKRINDCGGLAVYDNQKLSKDFCSPIYIKDEYDEFIKTDKGHYYKNVSKEWACVVSSPCGNDILAMSRSLGDLSLKRYGVIANPDIQCIDLDEIFNNLEQSNTICIVTASDGLWDNWIDDYVCKFVMDPSCLKVIIDKPEDGAQCVAKSLIMKNDTFAKINFGSSRDNASCLVTYITKTK
jgi:serine/threonine protein phosphatase PrpC